jgi:hypothetical protein
MPRGGLPYGGPTNLSLRPSPPQSITRRSPAPVPSVAMHDGVGSPSRSREQPPRLRRARERPGSRPNRQKRAARRRDLSLSHPPQRPIQHRPLVRSGKQRESAESVRQRPLLCGSRLGRRRSNPALPEERPPLVRFRGLPHWTSSRRPWPFCPPVEVLYGPPVEVLYRWSASSWFLIAPCPLATSVLL